MNVREHILEAAVRAFEAAGWRATTRRIAQEAGCNEVTLFQPFGSKENLIREALERAARRYVRLFLRAIGPPVEREAA